MRYIAENLKRLRKGKDLTQEEASEILGVSPQSVSKWERGDTLPDITLLPALANLYQVSVDEIIGMDKINDRQARYAIFTAGFLYMRENNFAEAIRLYSDALRTFPNDEDLMSYLAMALALHDDPAGLSRAITLCERVLSADHGGKVSHTTRAALCFIYYKAGEAEKATATARNLPHIRESRENVLAQLEKNPTTPEIDAYLKFIAIGEQDGQDIIEIDFGSGLLSMCPEHNLIEKINCLRAETDAPRTRDGFRKLPQIRVRDNAALAPNRLRVRHYADYLLDQECNDPASAVTEIIDLLRQIAQNPK